MYKSHRNPARAKRPEAAFALQDAAAGRSAFK
jgi:hypothetical protein